MTTVTPHTSKLKPFAAVRWLGIAIVSLVLGLWGVWDYAVDIPTREEKHARFLLAQAVSAALQEPDFQSAAYRERAGVAHALIDEAAQSLSVQQPPLPQRDDVINQLDVLREHMQSIAPQHEASWALALAVYREGIDTPRRTGQSLAAWSSVAFELSEPVINAFGSVAPPAAYDRWVQIVFIACLPFALWYFWVYLKHRGRVYRLDEDGALHLPNQSEPWAWDDIASIDMSKWMSRSIAVVRDTSGRAIGLDDHIYKDLHIIIGQIAHRFEPEKWTKEARPFKPDDDSNRDDSAEKD